MGIVITRDEINEVRWLSLGIDKIAGNKGAETVKDVIDDAVNKDLSIITFGKFATGKTTALKVILCAIPGNPEELTLDDIKFESDILLLKNGSIKYGAMNEDSIDNAYNKLTDKSTGIMPNTLLIELTVASNGKRSIRTISEIITTNDNKDNALISIVDVHKEKFRKLNDII